MRKHYFAAFALLFMTCLFAQDKACGWYGTLAADKRRAMPPFASSQKIVLISYFTTAYSEKPIVDDKGEQIIAEDSASVAKKMEMKVLREYDVSHILGKPKKFAALEVAELNPSEKDSLSRWFFNYRSKPGIDLNMQTNKCFTPRNAVLFIDDSGKVFAYIEVSFECNRFVIRPDVAWFNQLSLLSDCDGKYNILRDIFRQKKVGYGINILK
ncbi:MAG: hypothetical protein EOO50_02050 [Flavobacterium sp.]|uniref:hypothetical protein n=1 Tax=Flavobacterium sp. TaxID=239 RepID=UPI0012102483|nr:hypothetical protein [Flavobacterium sp.]RZJ68223.1 MAG: hypothetical protein EOO50_02050 [Flavobacterium sp.]